MRTQHFSKQSLFRLWLIVAVALVAGGSPPARPPIARAAGSFVVNSSADNSDPDAVLTLHEAILVANGSLTGVFTAGEQAQLGGCTFDGGGNITGGCGAGIFDNITFDSSVSQVNLISALPSLTDAGTWINGSSGSPRIDGNGLSSGHIFTINGDHITISNLTIVNGAATYDDIYIQGGTDARIAYNYLGELATATGCNSSGVTRYADVGVYVDSGTTGGVGANNGAAYIYGNQIGCHVIAGVYVYGAGYVYTGVQPDGTTADGNTIGVNSALDMLPNRLAGIHLTSGADHNLIANNTVSGNGWSGASVTGPGILIENSSNNTIRSNNIGVGPNGLGGRGNGMDGIRITGSNAMTNTIGGGAATDCNVISGNGQSGILLDGAPDNTIQANLIGLSGDGLGAIPNFQAGIAVVNHSDRTTIGCAGAWLFISGNLREGIYVADSSEVWVGAWTQIGVMSDTAGSPLGNGLEGIKLDAGVVSAHINPYRVAYNGGAGFSTAVRNPLSPQIVYGNGGLPIDLGNDGPTPNDAGGQGLGPDGWLDYPVIASINGHTITGTSCPDCAVTIGIAIGNPAANGGGWGGALGWATANASGVWTCTLPSGVNTGQVTMMANAPPATGNGSSEMSPRPQIFLPIVLK